MTSISVTLTRAHKIAERLKARATQLLQEAQLAAQATRVTGMSDAQGSRLMKQGASVADLVASAERFLRATAEVRTVISKENEARGISGKLAQLDAVNKMAAQLKSLLDGAKTGMIELGELGAYKPLGGESAVAGYNALTVNVVSAEARDKLQARLTELQREAIQLADGIAEANAARVSIALDEELSAYATGAN